MNDSAKFGVASVSPPALAVEHVSHAYGARKALDDVSFLSSRRPSPSCSA